MTLLLLQKLRLRDFNTVFLLHLLNLSLGNLKPYYSSLLSLFLSLIKLVLVLYLSLCWLNPFQKLQNFADDNFISFKSNPGQ